MCAGTHVVPGIVLGREQKLHYDPHLLSSHSIDALISRTSKHVQVGMPVSMCTHIPDKVCIHVQLHALPCLVVPTPPPQGGGGISYVVPIQIPRHHSRVLSFSLSYLHILSPWTASSWIFLKLTSSKFSPTHLSTKFSAASLSSGLQSPPPLTLHTAEIRWPFPVSNLTSSPLYLKSFQEAWQIKMWNSEALSRNLIDFTK